MFITVFKVGKDEIDIKGLDSFIRRNIPHHGEVKTIHHLVEEMGIENDIETACIEQNQLENLDHHLRVMGTLNCGGRISLHKVDDLYYLLVDATTELKDPEFDHISRCIIASDIIDYLTKKYQYVKIARSYETVEFEISEDKFDYSFIVS